MKPKRIYAALPVARDLREPEVAKSFAEKRPLNWVWVAFQNRKKRPDELETRPIG